MKSQWKRLLWSYLFWRFLLYGTIIISVVILVETLRLKNTGFEVKTLWDWMELLIIPFVLGLSAFLLNNSVRENEQKIARDHQQELAFQAYLDRMAELLLNEKLLTTKKKEIRDVARIRTLTVLRGLDKSRKGLTIRFLYEAKLIFIKKKIVTLVDADLIQADLSKANLSRADLSGANLIEADLSEINLSGANLSGANLIEASLFEADLDEANLSKANLLNASLHRASLRGADLSGINSLNNVREAFFLDVKPRGTDFYLADLGNANLINANLMDANLSEAYLNGANLLGADLKDTDLSGSNLRDAKVTNEQLATAKSLKGATMPDGTIHE